MNTGICVMINACETDTMLWWENNENKWWKNGKKI